MIRLEPIDHDGLVDRRIDLAGGGGSSRPLAAELLPADLDDCVGVQTVEGPPGDELVIALATERPAIHRRIERASQESLVVGNGCLLYTSPSPRDGLLS